MTISSAQASALPYPQLRASGALIHQIPHLGVVVHCGGRVREVGTFLFGADRIHPSDFRDLVAAALEVGSLSPMYEGLDLPHGHPMEVNLISQSPLCVARPGGVIRVTTSVEQVYLFATDLWWPDTISVLLDESATARAVSSRSGEIDGYLDIVQRVVVDSLLDDLMSISLVSVRLPDGDGRGSSSLSVAEMALTHDVVESVAGGLAERLFSLAILG
jgi:hypothetical protein